MGAVGGVRLFSQSKRRSVGQQQDERAVKRQREDDATHSQQPLSDGTVPEAKQNGESLPATETAPHASLATFKSLGLSEWLDRLCKSLGMTEPTEVQKGCVPSILAGRDVIGTAHTGSGKTAAFALPILQKLAEDPYGVYALVLTPTRYTDLLCQA